MLCLFLFVIGSYFLVQYIINKKQLYHILSLILFFISFETQSFLSFYSVPFILIIYHEKIYRNPLASFGKFRRYLSFVALPLGYWILKIKYLQPYGVNEGYMAIQMSQVLLSPFHVLMSFYNNLVVPITSISVNNDSLMLFFVPLLLTALYSYRLLRRELTESYDHIWILFCLGLLSYFAAVFPYIAIGRWGVTYGLEWLSRDQLIVPFAASLIILYGTKLLFRELELSKKTLALVLSLFIAICVFGDITNCLKFQRNWHKSLSLIEAFKTNDIIRNNKTFIVNDKTEYLNAILRQRWRDYEYNGMMRIAFGDASRYVDSLHHFKAGLINLSPEKIRTPEYLITIKPTSHNIRLSGTLKTMLIGWFNNKKFSNRINNILTIELKKIDNDTFKSIK